MSGRCFLMFVFLVTLVTGCTSCGGSGTAVTPTDPTPNPPPVAAVSFDMHRAFADLEKQCSFGPRNPGSQSHAECLQWLADQLADADILLRQEFSAATPFGGPYDFTNLLALYGADKPGDPLLLCAHWDTRPVADQDPDPANRNTPILGANDGASGVAVLLEIARLLNAHAPPRPVLIVLFDAEDSGKSAAPATFKHQGFCIGSEYLANNWPGEIPKPAEGILLDIVGRSDKHNPRCPPQFGASASLQFLIEGHSIDAHPQLVNDIWSIAERQGHSAFVRRVGMKITDDHLPMIQAGIPTINIIHFVPPEWHTIDDTPEYCSAEALFQSGDTLVKYIYGE